jgi:ankyrin repeat protein
MANDLCILHVINPHAASKLSSSALAAGIGDAAVVCLLLEAGADPDAADLFGFTPLHIAGKPKPSSCLSCISLIDVDLSTLQRVDARPSACESHATIVDLLMRFGASPLCKDRVCIPAPPL